MTEQEREELRRKIEARKQREAAERAGNMNNNQKTCPGCGSVIPANYDVCPVCGEVLRQGESVRNTFEQNVQQVKSMKPKKKFYKRWWFWLIVVCVGAYLFSPKNNEGENEVDVNVTDTQPVDSAESDVSESENNEAEEAESEEIGVGTTFEANEMSITVNSANLNFQDFDNSFGLYDVPEGMKYIQVSWTFDNISDDDKYVSIYDFDCYADDVSCEQAYLPEGSGLNDNFINTNLSSGRNISFETYYTVPINAQHIELEYDGGFGEADKVVVKKQ